MVFCLILVFRHMTQSGRAGESKSLLTHDVWHNISDFFIGLLKNSDIRKTSDMLREITVKELKV